MKLSRLSRLGVVAVLASAAALASAIRLNGPGNGYDSVRESTTAGGLVYSIGTSYVSVARGRDMVVTCYNVGGGLVWAQFLNGPANGNDEGIAITEAGGFIYVTGTTPIAGAGQDVYTAQLNAATGAVVNQAVWGSPLNLGDAPSDIIVTATPSVVVVGKTANPANTDVLMLAYTPGLALAAANMFNGGGDDYAAAAASDPAGLVYITGGTINGAGVSDLLLQRWTPAMAINWAMSISAMAASPDYGTDIQVTAAGVYAVGSTQRPLTGWDVFIVRTPLAGGAMARRAVGTIGSDYGVDIEVWAGGQVYVAGNYGGDIGLARLTGALAPIGTSIYASAGGGVDSCSSMALDPGTGDVYLAGSTTLGAANPDSLLVKFDPFGVQLWATTYDFAGLTDRANDVLYLGGGLLFTSGQSEGATMDMLTNRYNAVTGAILF